MAPTSDERREVAERLRGLDSAITSHDTLEQAVDKLLKATYGERPFSPMRYSVRNLCGLGCVLADLIDPTCHLLPSPDGGSEKVEQPMMRRKVTGNLVFAENGGKVLSFLLDEDMAGRIAKAVCDASALSDSTLSDKDMRMWLENLSGTSVKAIARGNALSEQAVRGAIKRVDRGRYAGEEIDL